MHGPLNVKQGTGLLYLRYLLQQAQYHLWSLIYAAQKTLTGHAMCAVHTTDLLNILFGAVKLRQNSVSMHAGNKKFRMNNYMKLFFV